MSINALNEKDLQIHSRQQLQKLARTHGVRANSKSTVIIKQLLEKFPEGVPSLSVSITPSKSSKRKLRGKFRTPSPVIEESRTEAQLPLPAANNLATPSSILSSPPSSPQIRAAVLHATAEGDASPQRPWPPTSLTYNHDEDSPENHEAEEESNASSEYTNETDATPPSSRANSPQPPCSPTAVKHAIETMRQVSEKDSTLSAQVESLRTLADNLIHQAHQLFQVLRRERGTRQRIQTYMTYFIPNNNRWGNRVQNGEILSEVQAAAVREEYLRNGGRGWKDQGRWEFEEIWGGPFKYAQLPAERHGVEWVEVEEGEEQKILNLRARLEEEAKRLRE
ncbi:hypothetical protein L218DRAFT_699152 [Marasmius fiardii PR-910]|nr:hypothetical protein L218DRAFT_699152 [Marasmius fiardii PR-910]